MGLLPFFNVVEFRQGCPLSLFLYIIMEDSLSIRLEKERVVSNFPGISMVRGIKEINHVLGKNQSLSLRGSKKF